MTLHILSFGIAKDITGKSFDMDINNTATVKEIKSMLEQEFPALKQLAFYRIAVNSEFAEDNHSLNAGDEVAIIPPVSGG